MENVVKLKVKKIKYGCQDYKKDSIKKQNNTVLINQTCRSISKSLSESS